MWSRGTFDVLRQHASPESTGCETKMGGGKGHRSEAALAVDARGNATYFASEPNLLGSRLPS
jgi:hypothetical protein